MRAGDVMRTSFATVKPSTPVIDTARLLLATNQRGLPVLDEEGRLVGIVAEGDLLHRDELGVNPPCNWLEALLGVEEGGRVRERIRALRVASIMTPNPLCDVVTEMDMREISQLPVVRAGRVIGIVSRFELVAALERSLSRNETNSP